MMNKVLCGCRMRQSTDARDPGCCCSRTASPVQMRRADAQKNQADVKLNFNTSSTTSTSAVINEFNGILTGGELQVVSVSWACLALSLQV